MASLFEREIKRLCPPPIVTDKNTMQWGQLTLLYCDLDDDTFFMRLSSGANSYTGRYHPSCIPECVVRVQNWIRWFA